MKPFVANAGVVVVVILGLGTLAFSGCSISMDHAAAEDYTNAPEAGRWLQTNESESALASNRFGLTSEAVRFVNELYAAGATRVVVPEEAIEDDGVEVYADALVVLMPADPAKRRRVQAICDREIRREGFDPSEGGDADQVFLWWD